MEYYLMRRDEIVTICDMDDNGTMLSFSKRFRNPELAPYSFRYRDDSLLRWWRNRATPINQGNIKKMLEARGFDTTHELLINNLGLSLTDYYWMKPLGSRLKWKDVNLFENDFRPDDSWNLELEITHRDDAASEVPARTPNSSLKGELEKTWVISDGRRYIIKGNHGSRSAESINECIATRLHELQGYDNYTEYRLIHIKNKPYEYGCIAEAFTNSKYELLPAYALITSCPRPDGVSNYEHLINVCCNHGMDQDQLRSDLEYQIMTDYVLTNADRHMENVGILRDADTLELVRMAPIYDTGRCMFAGGFPPFTQAEFDRIEINSFCNTEAEMLSLVTDRSTVNPEVLPDGEYIRSMYSKDPHCSDGMTELIVRAYEKKVEMFMKWMG